MYKLIFDADGLIKSTLANVIIHLCKKFKCFISSDVFNEVVIEGKKRFYEDAYVIEELIDRGLIHIRNAEKEQKASLLLENTSFGEGEISTLYLFYNLNAEAIVSDDEYFLQFLSRNNIHFIIPIDLIKILVEKKIINKREGSMALEKIKPFVKEEYYNKIKKTIGGK